MPNILIVDDNPGIRKEIRQRLESAGLAVCGEAADGLEAIEKAPALRPDLVILDAAMPRLNGIEAAGRLKQLQPDLPIVLHTFHADLIRSQSLPAGVSEIVAKGEPLIPRVLSLLAKPHSNQRRRSR